MKKLTIILMMAFVLFCGMAKAQIHLPESHVAFNLPSNQWRYLKTIEVDNNTKVFLYVFSGRVILDNQGDTVLPNLRIFVKKDYKPSIYELITERFMQQPFQSIDEYYDGLPAPGLGYVGAHTSPQDGKDYAFRMIYFKDKDDKAYEFRATTTMDTYSQLEEEFKAIMESVTIDK